MLLGDVTPRHGSPRMMNCGGLSCIPFFWRLLTDAATLDGVLVTIGWSVSDPSGVHKSVLAHRGRSDGVHERAREPNGDSFSHETPGRHA